MTRLFRFWQAGLILTTALVIAGGLSGQDAKGKKYALLVGINDYQHDKLPDLLYAVNDAKKLGQVLAKAGFETTTLTDETGKTDPNRRPTKANIERALEAVLKKCQRGDIVLVALAGHGLQFEKKLETDKDDCYFCPQDGRPFRDQVNSLVSLGNIYSQMERSFAGMKVLLVDACRDDPDSARGTRSGGITADLAPRPPEGVAALFSCRAGEKAFENPKLEHGVFFYHIIQGLEGKAQNLEREVTFASLASYVNRAVPRWLKQHVQGGKQRPHVRADYSEEAVLAHALPLRQVVPPIKPPVDPPPIKPPPLPEIKQKPPVEPDRISIDYKPTFGSVTLDAGFLPDPFTKDLVAGGAIQTQLGGVKAWVHKAPDFKLYYTAGKYALTIYAVSKSDTTLLVNLPDGTWIADDDSGGNLNPFLRFANPESGRYDIWVGTYGPKLAPATLYITELK